MVGGIHGVVQTKMTRGALIFAFNNGVIDYVKLAAWCATNIQRHLNIPVALVTDVSINDPVFDRVIVSEPPADNSRFFSDFNDTILWRNQNRSDAYEISPWDETLVIDADYIVASDQLQNVFRSQHDFLAHRWACDITGLTSIDELNYFGRNNMPMWWATLMYFRRSTTAELIFDSMKMVRDNWQHYCNLYNNRRDTFRNDYALSIALNIVNGHVQPMGIPWPLVSLIPTHRLKQTDTDEYRIDFINSENQSRWISIRGQDFHAMGKRDLGDIVANQG